MILKQVDGKMVVTRKKGKRKSDEKKSIFFVHYVDHIKKPECCVILGKVLIPEEYAGKRVRFVMEVLGEKENGNVKKM